MRSIKILSLFMILFLLGITLVSARLLLIDTISLRSRDLNYLNISNEIIGDYTRPQINIRASNYFSERHNLTLYQEEGYFRTQFGNRESFSLRFRTRDGNSSMLIFNESLIEFDIDSKMLGKINGEKKKIDDLRIRTKIDRINNESIIRSIDSRFDFEFKSSYYEVG